VKQYYIYIMASGPNGTLYTGVTSNLVKRIYQHKNKMMSGFTAQYEVKILVYYEITTDVTIAITREKNIKAWRRTWKTALIEKDNPTWRDLYPEITQ
jgi:putative endonuclease